MDLQFNKEDIKKNLKDRNERAADKFRCSFEKMFGKTFGEKTNRTKTKFK